MTHMNEYLPERLAANPLQAMESDSDIEAIADAVISASVLRDECDGGRGFQEQREAAPLRLSRLPARLVLI